MTIADEKLSFSRRLKEAMRRSRLESESPTRIARDFNLRYDGHPITAQAVRKWLDGKALPSQDKVRALALWLDVTPQWLTFGDAGERKDGHAAAKQDSASYLIESAALIRKFDLLNDGHKKIVTEVIRALLRLEGKQ
jgi:transcriptional regulator with XRE-family HTH domain